MDNQNTFSPAPTIERLFTFPQAMEAIVSGRKITRKSWTSVDEYGILADGWLTIHTQGQFHQWLVNDGDLFSTDWLVI